MAPTLNRNPPPSPVGWLRSGTRACHSNVSLSQAIPSPSLCPTTPLHDYCISQRKNEVYTLVQITKNRSQQYTPILGSSDDRITSVSIIIQAHLLEKSTFTRLIAKSGRLRLVKATFLHQLCQFRLICAFQKPMCELLFLSC